MDKNKYLLLEELVLECMDSELCKEEREFSYARLLYTLNSMKDNYIGSVVG
jgi:hypothetical protein